TACGDVVDPKDKIDTTAFYPNADDNMWQYQESGSDNDINTWQLENDNFTAAKQTMFIHDDADPAEEYIAMSVNDNDTDTLKMLALFWYDANGLDSYDTFDNTPWTLIKWDDYGMEVGDKWDSLNTSGRDKDFWGYSGINCDTVGFDLDGEVKEKITYDYKGTSLTAYLIEHTGKVIYEVTGVDPEDWERYNYQQDFVFVPKLGFVKMVSYYSRNGQMTVDVTENLIDTNVTLP
ncbi:hypothetical protein K8R78_02775, partial [bacterium]|nr:hypothetical protein [bacterium]